METNSSASIHRRIFWGSQQATAETGAHASPVACAEHSMTLWTMARKFLRRPPKVFGSAQAREEIGISEDEFITNNAHIAKKQNNLCHTFY